MEGGKQPGQRNDSPASHAKDGQSGSIYLVVARLINASAFKRGDQGDADGGVRWSCKDP